MPLNHEQKTNSIEMAHQNAVGKFIRYLISHLVESDSDLSLDKLAQQDCYSKPYLIAILRKFPEQPHINSYLAWVLVTLNKI